MELVTIETPTLGNRGYLVVTGQEALVVDPPRDIDRVVTQLEQRGVDLRLVVETHRHADYVTGGLALARMYDAPYAVPVGDPPARFLHLPVVDGTELGVGDVILRAVHTPGHAPHHQAYVVIDSGRTVAVFTGGSLLVDAVGRTDLVDPELTDALSGAQWQSVRRLLREVDPEAEILPTHGFGSLCAAGSPAQGRRATVGDQARGNPAAHAEEAEFVRGLRESYEPFPSYYARLPELNAAGPTALDLRPPPAVDSDVLARRVAAGEWVLDVRDRQSFAQCHLAGTINVEATGKVGVYLAWLLPAGAPVTVVADNFEKVTLVQRDLGRVGVDRIVGHAIGSPAEWAGGDVSRLGTYPTAAYDDLAIAATRRAVTVLDVRACSEHAADPVRGALNIPLPELPDRLDEVRRDHDGEVWVHCATGFRAAIATSLLARAGVPTVLLDGAPPPSASRRTAHEAPAPASARRAG